MMEPSPNQRVQKTSLVVAGVMLGVFLSGIDALVVGTAMPTVVQDLGGIQLYSWVFSSYMLTTAVFMPLFGKLSDLWGRKRLFYVSILIFVVGSMLSGTSQNMLQLVLYRVIQGIGSGGMAAIPFAIIGSIFPPEKRGRAFGLVAAVWGVASILGPGLGSFIVTHFSWRWVFYVNIPFGLASVILINLAYHEVVERKLVSVDVKGAAGLGIAITTLLVAFFVVGEGRDITSPAVLLLSGLSLGTIYAFTRVEKVAKDPVLPLEFFRVKAFSAANVCGFIGGFAIFGGVAFVPLFIQSVQGGSPMRVAIAITPMSVGWALASVVTGQVLHLTGPRRIVLSGMACMGVGFLLASFVRSDSPLYYVILSTTLIGVGMGVQTPALLATAQNALHSSVLGVATSSQMLARILGGAMGTSMMGAALTHSMQNEFLHSSSGMLANLPDAIKSRLSEPNELLTESMRANLDPEHLNYILGVFTHALHNVFITGLAVATAGLLAALFLPRDSA
jgi:EmrB/QacA subfamily drug resistance transporter